MNAVLILGNQLFSLDHYRKKIDRSEVHFFMREDRELCTYYRFHKHKIIFFLAAMRSFRDELKEKKLSVHYEEISNDKKKYEEALEIFLHAKKIKKISFFEIEDKFFEKRVLDLLKEHKVDFEVWPSPMFLTTRAEFGKYLGKSKRPFMKTFYEQQRKRLEILVTKDHKPVGGQWSFDVENRLSLPEKVRPPDLEQVSPNATTRQVQKLSETFFSDHPGSSQDFWLPVDHEGAKRWLKKFLRDRLDNFGPYEDAIPRHSDFVYHSILTPFLNSGLLTPEQVVRETLSFAKTHEVPLASLEGFLRQIIGWREFIRGIYQNFSDQQENSNFFQHKKKLSDDWYKGTTGIAPLDHAIKKVLKYGYNHHIERLMVIGSLMLLLEVDPKEAHRWFMEMYIDSSDWVMGPNVFGMALFSDGGIFATKPYFCGSNYYRKMGGYKANETWCDAVDGLYWGFIDKHQSFFRKNPRLSMMVRTLEKMDPAKRKRLSKSAEELKKRITRG